MMMKHVGGGAEADETRGVWLYMIRFVENNT